MSSVLLQLLFYINGIYLIFYCLATLALLLYKSQAFSYPEDLLSVDLMLFVVTAIAEVLRLYLDGLRELGLSNLEKRRLWGDLRAASCTPILKASKGLLTPAQILLKPHKVLRNQRLTSAFPFLQGVRGNLTEEESLLGLSLVMTVGSTFLAVYFIVWQTYVLKTDIILNTVLLVLYGMESILKVSTIAAFTS
ncbi:transmembrane protein 80 [Amazona ochrocephala]